MDKGLESLGMLTFLRSYSKDGEDWYGTTERYLKFFTDKYPKLKAQIQGYGKFIHEKKVVPSMRLFQFSGEAAEKEPLRAYNCAFLAPTVWQDFGDIVYLLCCGCGVGSSVESHYVSLLPDINEGFDELFIIPDNKEGWADSIVALLNNPMVRFDYSNIRKAGAKLSSGGTAGGPKCLKKAHRLIRNILTSRTRLTSEDVADIICLIAQAVVSGGSRRSAIILLTSVYDSNMANFKSGDWWETKPWRAKANISSIAVRGTEEVEVALNEQLNSPYGERGVVLVDRKDYGENIGCNPCVRGDTLILTKEGEFPINTLVGKSVEVWNGYEWSKVVPKVTGTNQQMLKVTLSNGRSLVCTKYHSFIQIVSNQISKIEAHHLKVSDLVVSGTKSNNSFNESEVTSIEEVGIDAEVFCFNEPKRHLGVFNGILTGQCGEVSLKNKGLCNLSEVIIPNIVSEQDFYDACRAASFFGTLQASLTDFKYVSSDFANNAKEEALLGVSLTGMAQAGEFLNENVLSVGADVCVKTNHRYANVIGINPAKRVTTLKPSGSVSAALGTTSGIHAAYFEYGVRRVRVTRLSPLGKALIAKYGISEGEEVSTPYGKNILPKEKYRFIVPEVYDDKDIVLQFPCHYENAIYRKNEGAVQLLERAKTVYTSWVKGGHKEGQETNNISITVSFKEEEKEELKAWCIDNQDSYRAISTLPYDCKAYALTPFEELSKEEYEKYLAKFPDIDWEALGVKSEAHKTSACSGGGCEVT